MNNLSSQTIGEPQAPASKPPRPEIIGEKKPTQYIVVDTGVTPDHPHRTHELVVNNKRQKFVFQHGVDNILPKEIALRFLSVEGFSVYTMDGKLIEPAPKAPDHLKSALPPEFCVAKLSELKKEALLQRAVPLPGGDIFTSDSSSAEMAAFIEKYNISQRPNGRDKDEDEGLDGMGMSQAELDRAFREDPTSIGI